MTLNDFDDQDYRNAIEGLVEIIAYLQDKGDLPPPAVLVEDLTPK